MKANKKMRMAETCISSSRNVARNAIGAITRIAKSDATRAGVRAGVDATIVAARAYVKSPRALVATGIAAFVALGLAMPPAPAPDAGFADFDAENGTVFKTADITIRKPSGVMVVPGSAGKLYKEFRSIGYRLEDVRAGDGPVPRVFVKDMPRDIRHVPSIATRKAVFIKTMLPLILQTNEELRAARTRIKTLTGRLSKGEQLVAGDAAWLAAQYERYGVKPGNARALLVRVDVIPPSLALAQAAEESGWGTSRFAQEGRALFGQRTYNAAPGISPSAAAEEGFKVKSFEKLLDAVRSYALNLNSHRAYGQFRRVRSSLRGKTGNAVSMNSYRLADTLLRYSERGERYIETIKSIIRYNDLRALDDAQLSQKMDKARKLNGA